MGTSSRVLILYYAISVILLFAFGFLKLLQKFCWMEGAITGLMKLFATIDMPKEDYWENLFGWEMFKTQQKCLQLDLMKEAKKGLPTPNPRLVALDGSKTFQLLDFARGSRPLVVNFGSCTCPVFMERLQQFGEIVDEFSSTADFLTIYIEEAHPTDEWRLKNTLEIHQHKTLEERCKSAQLLLTLAKLNCPLLVDSMDNKANKAFAAIPIRLYIIQDQIVRFIGGVGPTFYNIQDVKKWLENNVSKDLNNNNPVEASTI